MKKPTPLHVLNQYFGYSEFRGQQSEIIDYVLGGKDALVLMPTGGGKSLCYQIPALIFEGLTVVISPLIALMKDQVDALKVNGISAAYLNSTLSVDQQSEVFKQVKNGEIKMLYLAPERLVGKQSDFISFLKSVQISFIAIDEAHCISQWGHDFRPEYAMLGEMKAEFNDVPMLALTATADEHTRKDILKQLKLRTGRTFLSSFNRENIKYTVLPKQKSYDQLLNFLDLHTDEAGVIYTLSRASTESIAQRLNDDGYNARPYHAGLSNDIKAQNQELFVRDEVKIIVATVAFGMGIDKSNVRFVVHMDLPKNIEGYYQETGRAGRDGLASEALLFYSYSDVMKLESFVAVDGNDELTGLNRTKLKKMAEYADLRTCRRKYLLNYFNEDYDDHCNNCDVCLRNAERADATVIVQKALSAVIRLGERYGQSFVIDFLRGSNSAKIKPEHKSIKTYGVGKDLSKADWNHYFKEIIHEGLLALSTGQYPILTCTEEGRSFLLEKRTMSLAEPAKALLSEPHSVTDLSYDKGLFEKLKSVRYQFAQRDNLPAYIILSDASLAELASYLPTSKDNLVKISGFGEVKIQKYGEAFIAAIVDYAKSNGMKTDLLKGARIARKTKKSESKGTSYLLTLELFKSGKNLNMIAEERELAISTIEGHLNQAILSGELEVNTLISDKLYDEIKTALVTHGSTGLKAVKENLRDEITYGEIRAVSNHLQFLDKSK